MILHPQASQHEILAVLARYLPARRFLEIGVRDGCTLWVVIEAARRDLKLVACADDWGKGHGGTNWGSHAYVEKLLHAIGYYKDGGEALWLDGKSQETLPKLIEQGATDPFDLIHVDGDHDYEPCFQDLVNSWDLLRDGGYIVAHDASHPPVRQALDTFASKRENMGAVIKFHSGGHGTAVIEKVRQP